MEDPVVGVLRQGLGDEEVGLGELAVVVEPSITGMAISRRIRSGGWACAVCSAACPPVAGRTINSAISNTRPNKSKFSGMSSPNCCMRAAKSSMSLMVSAANNSAQWVCSAALISLISYGIAHGSPAA